MSKATLFRDWRERVEGLGFTGISGNDDGASLWAYRGQITARIFITCGDPCYSFEVKIYDGIAESYSVTSFEDALSGVVRQIEAFDVDYQKTKSDLAKMLADVKE